MADKELARIPATLIPGDGIGPEITAAVVDILDALGAPFDWDAQQGGMAAIEKGGDPLPESLLDSIGRTKLALKGPLTTPVGGGFRSVNVRLREAFGLYANLRPVRTMVPGGRYENIDIVLVRENLEGLYVAFEHYIPIGDDPGLVGGLGMAPGANIGEKAAIFEAVHGSAPDIAGKGVANPLALLLAAGLMLDHVERSNLADRLREAVRQTLQQDGVRTRDLGGTASTKDFAAAIISR